MKRFTSVCSDSLLNFLRWWDSLRATELFYSKVCDTVSHFTVHLHSCFAAQFNCTSKRGCYCTDYKAPKGSASVYGSMSFPDAEVAPWGNMQSIHYLSKAKADFSGCINISYQGSKNLLRSWVRAYLLSLSTGYFEITISFPVVVQCTVSI